MQTLAARVKEQPRAEGFEEILMPGEPEARNERERLTQGIPLTHDVFESLRSEGKRVGVPFPSS
jgi:LDH2 family malate/lactate/ureidoglycolate dehydrogenase